MVLFSQLKDGGREFSATVFCLRVSYRLSGGGERSSSAAARGEGTDRRGLGWAGAETDVEGSSWDTSYHRAAADKRSQGRAAGGADAYRDRCANLRASTDDAEVIELPTSAGDRDAVSDRGRHDRVGHHRGSPGADRI